jgi:hypothetical protein
LLIVHQTFEKAKVVTLKPVLIFFRFFTCHHCLIKLGQFGWFSHQIQICCELMNFNSKLLDKDSAFRRAQVSKKNKAKKDQHRKYTVKKKKHRANSNWTRHLGCCMGHGLNKSNSARAETRAGIRTYIDHDQSSTIKLHSIRIAHQLFIISSLSIPSLGFIVK